MGFKLKAADGTALEIADGDFYFNTKARGQADDGQLPLDAMPDASMPASSLPQWDSSRRNASSRSVRIKRGPSLPRTLKIRLDYQGKMSGGPSRNSMTLAWPSGGRRTVALYERAKS